MQNLSKPSNTNRPRKIQLVLGRYRLRFDWSDCLLQRRDFRKGIFLFNFLWSLKWGKKAEMDPWHGTTLEWAVPSPPPHDNFGGQEPTIYRGPYELSVPGYAEDYLPQHLPPERVGRAR